MKHLSLLLALAPLLALAADPVREPVETIEQAREAAKLVTVAEEKIEMPQLGSSNTALARACWDIERPSHNEITATDWRAKWDLFAKGLAQRADEQHLDSAGLVRCLEALKQGSLISTRPTRIESPITEEQFLSMSKSTDQEGVHTIEVGGYPPNHLTHLPTSVPTAAFLIQTSSGPCWVIFACWEYEEMDGSFSPPRKHSASQLAFGMSLTHDRFWVMDSATCDVMLYCSCE
ncbi:MAG: hypothetical protein IPL39_19700 [Opitutaceae bacterium]|nr:hypothetical protein [Opitutaceae bacterium]